MINIYISHTDEIAIYKAKADEIVNNKYEMPDKCIFVDDYTGACRIYEVRPLVCRLYGVLKPMIMFVNKSKTINISMILC